MKISLNGFGENTATFEAESGVLSGMPVKMTGNGVVGVCGVKDKFAGVAVNVRDGFAAVQLGGYIRMPYSGSTVPKVGYQEINCADSKKVQVDSNGKSILITDVDTAGKTCGMIL